MAAKFQPRKLLGMPISLELRMYISCPPVQPDMLTRNRQLGKGGDVLLSGIS